MILVPAGAEGAGEVLDAANADGGRPGKLVIAGRFLNIDDRRVGLRGMQIMVAGQVHRNTFTTWNGYGAVPMSVMEGEAVVISAGTRVRARLAQDLEIELDEATTPAAGAEFPTAPDERSAPSAVGSPPSGQGRIVFFRPSSMEAMIHSFSGAMAASLSVDWRVARILSMTRRSAFMSSTWDL